MTIEKYDNVVLFSGGIDSTVVATMMAAAKTNSILLFVNFNNQTHLQAAKNIAAFLRMPLHVTDLPAIQRKGNYIAGYRLWLYLSAATLADNVHAYTIYTGEVAFPDSLEDDTTNTEWREFVGAENNVTQEAWKRNRQRFIELYSDMYENQTDAYDFVDPLWGLRKKEIVNLGRGLRAPLHLTSSCQNPKLDTLAFATNCGTCWACESAKRALT
jgi:7-cyano-7-deazaguanine synthase in queuosine biosynthesis